MNMRWRWYLLQLMHLVHSPQDWYRDWRTWKWKNKLRSMQITALLRSIRILRRVLENCRHSNSSERPSPNADVKSPQGVAKVIRKTATTTMKTTTTTKTRRTMRRTRKRGSGRLENRTTNRDCSDYSIFKINQNAQKSPGDLRTLAVTETPVKYRQLKFVWRT